MDDHYYVNTVAGIPTIDIIEYDPYSKNNFNKHLLTKKHIENMGPNGVQSSKKVAAIYICENCDKEYQTRGGLRKHKKKCKRLQ